MKKVKSCCYECRAVTNCVDFFKPVCADCLLKAYQLLNPPTCHTVVKISDIDTAESNDELHIDGETTAIDDVYLDGDTTTIDGASFKGILHELSASDMDCDVVQVEPFGGTATIHG